MEPVGRERGKGRPSRSQNATQRINCMLYTIALILIIAWLLGLVSAYTMGGFIHILLVVAVVVVLVRLIQGRRVG
jgi:hypothetical protein